MNKIFLGLVAFLLFFTSASAELVFQRWDTTVTIVNGLPRVEVHASATVKLPKDQQQTQWGYTFGSDSSIELLAADINGRDTYGFQNNELTFDCGALPNGSPVNIHFIYIDRSAGRDPALLQYWAQIPSFVAGTQGKVAFTIPADYRVCSLHPEFLRYDDTLVWQGVVPKKGFASLFRLTPRTARWQVNIQNVVQGTEPFSKLEIWYPVYFLAGKQTVAEYSIEPTQKAAIQQSTDIQHYFLYNDPRTDRLVFTIKGLVSTGTDLHSPRGKPGDYLTVPVNEQRALKGQTTRILAKNNAVELPNYIALGQWVHDHLTYNINYSGKSLSTLQIMEAKQGVCEHFTQLYIALCRTAGIPAVKVSGYAFNEQLKWQEHAWAQVFVDGRWIPIDPTWALFAGELPASHIAFYQEGMNQSKYVMTGYTGEIRTQTTIHVEPR